MRSLPFALPDRWFAPAPLRERIAFLTERPYAHRGLHDAVRVENSLAAADAALAVGHGIECDVQASRDDAAFVFHDALLDRLTPRTGRLRDHSARILDTVTLHGGEPIPTLHALLTRVLGKVPLLIELKAPGRHVGPLCLAVRRDLEGYRGPVAVMSFNPEVPRWFAAHAPHIVRGLVVTEAGRRHLRGRIERHLALWRGRPQFLAYDVRDLPSRFAAAQRARGLPVLTWTVRDARAETIAHIHADQIIYERAA
ncbi:MAG: glycerophosphodiester phosphodiesterase family protein [Sphingomonas sp.]